MLQFNPYQQPRYAHAVCHAIRGALYITGVPELGRGVFWELCAGTSRLTHATYYDGWSYITPVEINNNAKHDLTDMFFVEKALMVGKAGIVNLSHSGTPCSSMSQALTPPWRSVEHPKGLPSLSGAALQKVKVGNIITTAVAMILAAFDDWGVAVPEETQRPAFIGYIQMLSNCLHRL